MADNYKWMAINAPSDCKLSMVFKFPTPHRFDEFVDKIDFVKLFKNVSYWQSARFRFLVHGFNFENYNVVKEIDLYGNLHYCHVEKVAEHLRGEFNTQSYGYVASPIVVHMEIYFQ